MKKKAIVVIPARYSSSRFPGKPLALLAGKPVLRHVYDNAVKAQGSENVFIATDDKRIEEKFNSFGANVIMTSERLNSGTDRVAEASRGLDADIILNLQGDEPFIDPNAISRVIDLFDGNNIDIGTAAATITNKEDYEDPNAVKVVLGLDNEALYFSRSPIPHCRDFDGFLKNGGRILKHVGVYAYRREVLERFAALSATSLERAERLEQLRALENGFKIKVHVGDYFSIGIDTPEDLERAEEFIKKKQKRDD